VWFDGQTVTSQFLKKNIPMTVMTMMMTMTISLTLQQQSLMQQQRRHNQDLKHILK